jgi:hypothetical protein
VSAGFTVALDGTLKPWLNHTGFGNTVLDVLSAEWTEDESWSPAVKGTISVAQTPAVQALEPKKGAEVELWVHHNPLDGSAGQSASWRFLVLDKATSPVSGVVQLEVASMDALAHLPAEQIAYSANSTIVGTFPFLLARALAAKNTLAEVAAQFPTQVNTAGVHPSALLQVTNMPSGQMKAPTFAAIFDSIAEINGLRWFCDRLGVWTWRGRYTAPGTADLVLSTGRADSTVTSLSLVNGFADYANEVRIEYSDGTVFEYGYAAQSTGPLAIGAAPRSTLTLQRTGRPPSQALRDAAARNVLSRVITYGGGEEIVAVADLNLVPDNTVRVAPQGETARNRLVRSVARRYPAAEMTVITRNPST